MSEPKKLDVLLIPWVESEAGWGQRPDGCSLHQDPVSMRQYIEEYVQNERDFNPSGEVPNEYSRPDSSTGKRVTISGSVLKTFLASLFFKKSGIRLWQTEHREALAKQEIV